MSKDRETFLELSLAGSVMLDEIDDFVDEWHESDLDIELHDYLGMSFEEYAAWAESPGALAYIITARKEKRNLGDVMRDAFNEYRAAARADNDRHINELKSWLMRRGKVG